MTTNPQRKPLSFLHLRTGQGIGEAIPAAASWRNHKGTTTLGNPIKAESHPDQQLFPAPDHATPLQTFVISCCAVSCHTESQWLYANIAAEKSSISRRADSQNFPSSRRMTSALLPSNIEQTHEFAKYLSYPEFQGWLRNVVLTLQLLQNNTH